MRAYKNVALITAIVLVALLAVGGCGVKSQGEFTSTPAGLACIEMMKKVPKYYKDSFVFWDVKTLRSDPDHAEVYQFCCHQWDDLFELWGIDGDGVDYLVQAGSITLVGGDFDLGAIRENIPVNFVRDTNYEALEVWMRQPVYDPQKDFDGGVILAEGLFIRGRDMSDMDDLLSVYEHEKLSLYYDENAVEMLERLPEALEIEFGRTQSPKGIIISAAVIAKEEAGAYRWIWIYKFESPEYVASDYIEEYFQRYGDSHRETESEFAERGEPRPFHSFTLEKDGEFVEWSIIAEGLYLMSVIFYS